MADLLILQPLDDSEEADRIVGAFEQRTGLAPDVRDDGRYYEVLGKQHRELIVQTLTEIDPGWTDHLGFKLPG